ncbi:DNA polymerase III subunit gamma/tau [Celeribacter sp. PS-C1]|uniref:DNA polymerase III subunit gamma/tau n=1 Tax=Celeribacter sp. PS-C1 TaxID=2820813 RepID=UPI001CA5C8AD|nr:DNA polymerase III subunit gamma/tau [Celeribacter sp. PS-C1]MBW6417965.1 DNA polymerase III subunit gamma/tau [Celeribacter sp. PS-C1]
MRLRGEVPALTLEQNTEKGPRMTDTTTGYKVLARKYRPETFVDLIGQDAMVRTLKNAFAADRIAQAFIMTGIRGTGKTTTARIIAKGMNCIGPDGTGMPTTDPCGVCEHCVAISEGRHVDVMEMDAASRTGVGDIREIIDSVHYRAASARYKIYIIDEVHMLSTSAFNALLKTLEEPPAHVKFIFATTEIRKVPVTVLSRCQRFDLRRIEPEVMMNHLAGIAKKEGSEVAQDALALITRAAEGSVRDALSLLDQAISHGAGETTVDQVRAMLGLADRGRVLDLFDMIMAGDAAGALEELGGQYADGADPLAVLRDLAEITHWVSVIKITPSAAEDPTIGPDERARGLEMAEKLPMRVMSRMWQMLLKAIEEVSAAPNAMMASEMAIIRLTHVADLPMPEDLVRKLNEQNPPPRPPSGPAGGGAPAGGGSTHAQGSAQGAPRGPVHGATMSSGAATATALAPEASLARFTSFESVVALLEEHRAGTLLIEAKENMRIARYAPGRIEFQPWGKAAQDLAPRLADRLHRLTGVRWMITIAEAPEDVRTIYEIEHAEEMALRAEAMKQPIVAKVFELFPDAKISDIRTPEKIASEAATEALQEVEDEWDPFEE